jgi:hypothetical protein
MAEQSWSGKVGGGNLAEKLYPPEPEATGRDGAMLTHPHEQISLGLCFAEGDIDAIDLPYVDYAGAKLEGGVLKVYFNHATVRAEGMHLKAIRAAIRQHRVVELRERHRSELLLDDGQPYISKLEVDDPEPRGLRRKA